MAQTDSSEQYSLFEIRDVLIDVANRAGEMITNAKPNTAKVDSKINSVDLVTETDKAVENMISSTLLSRYPTFKFLGEETYKPGMKLTSDPTFIVDPIDGTTNFVHGYPYVSVSLGFAVKKEAVVGVVFNPVTQQMYTGVKGNGSYLHDTRTGLQTQLPLRRPLEPLTGLGGALLILEWGNDRSGHNYQTKIRTFAKLLQSKEEGGAMAHSARSLGSAALNLCAVATGSADVYWEGGCWAWDVCAGWVILEEAGGLIADGNPGEWNPPIDHRKYVAIRGSPDSQGQKELVEEFWSFVEGRMDYES